MTAIISDCGKFRFRLWRRWGDGKPLLFVMLNPSTADAEVDDRTIRRCVRFAKAHDFQALEVVNLFAYRATDPKDLKRAGYPVGHGNDDVLVEATRDAGAVCLAWGANVAGLDRPKVVLTMLRRVRDDLQCLRVTRRGHPAHPLMLPSSCRLQPFLADTLPA